MEKKTVLITGIGGNVGQGIIRNIKKTGYPIKIIGTNISHMSAGNHLVDVFYEVPFSYEESYIYNIIEIVNKEKVDLIIPSTDFEVENLSNNYQQLNCKIACSGKESTSIYLDKFLTHEFHKERDIPFAKSCLPSNYNGEFEIAIAKPRKGRGSRGLIKNVKSVAGLNDEEYLIQEMHFGTEITSACYVSYISNKLIGTLTMERSLENGATTYCKVTNDFDDIINSIAIKIIQETDTKGSFNIQSIVTESNEIHPFEVNCRISGTNSIRSFFGFEDVKYTIEELLYGIAPSKIEIKKGIAYRYLADVIYAEGLENKNNTDNFIIF